MAANYPGTSNESIRNDPMPRTTSEDDTIILPPDVQRVCLLVLSSTEEFIAYTFGGSNIFLSHAKTGETIFTSQHHTFSVCRIGFQLTD
ncbi:unnamed protein product, partial [Larinioides sclopetarius]